MAGVGQGEVGRGSGMEDSMEMAEEENVDGRGKERSWGGGCGGEG